MLTRREIFKLALGQLMLKGIPDPFLSNSAKGQLIDSSFINPNFYSGKIYYIENPHCLIIRTHQGKYVKARIQANTTSLWKGGFIGESELKVGDFVYIDSIPLNTNEVLVTRGWINIVSFCGKVSVVAGDTIIVGGRKVKLTSSTDFVVPVEENSEVHVIGFIENGVIKATRFT